MKKFFFVVAFFLMLKNGVAQESPVFSAEINKTNVSVGQKIKVTYTLKDAKGDAFEDPDFKDFEVLSGPNVSSNMSIMNGNVSQSMSYTYYVAPKREGIFELPSAAIKVGKKTLRTAPIAITVLAKSENSEDEEEVEDLRTNDPFADFFGRRTMPETMPKAEPTKKKRATSRM